MKNINESCLTLTNMEGNNQHSRYATTGRLAGKRLTHTMTVRKQQQRREDLSGCSLTSASSSASSSGCSSIETSSSARYGVGKSAPIRSRSEDDYLEINEYLYLGRGAQAEASALVKIAAGERSLVERQIPLCCANKHQAPEDLLSSGQSAATMTEFSAFTLRKSFKFQNQSQSRKQAKCLCCCCTAQCRTVELGNQVEQQTSLSRGGTIVAGKGNNKHEELPDDTRSALISRPRVPRKSMPVPPPVVPLYKELEAIGRLKKEQKPEATCSEKPEDVGSSCGEFRVRAKKILAQDHSHSSSFLPAKTLNLSDIPQDLDEPFARKQRLKFYCADWENLREQQKRRCSSTAAGSASGQVDKFSSSSSTGTSEQSLTWSRKTAGKFLERLKQSVMANFHQSQTFAVNSCQEQLQKQTLQQRIMCSSLSQSSSSTESDVESCSPGALSTANKFPSTLSGSGSGSASSDEIYDTPEYNAQSKSLSSLATGPDSRVHPSSGVGSSKRPSIPPPPPPPPSDVTYRLERRRDQGVCAISARCNLPVPGIGGHKVAREPSAKLAREDSACKAGAAPPEVGGGHCQSNTLQQETSKSLSVVGHAHQVTGKVIASQSAVSGKLHEVPGAPLAIKDQDRKQRIQRKVVKWAQEKREDLEEASPCCSQQINGLPNGKSVKELETGTIFERNCRSEKSKNIGTIQDSIATSFGGNILNKVTDFSRKGNKMGSNQSHSSAAQLLHRQQQQNLSSNQQIESASGEAKRLSLGNISSSATTSVAKKSSALHKKLSGCTASQPGQKLLSVEPEISVLERRRKSIQDGDVFIYPSLYKDLNECQKCSRDNKICNCIISAAVSPTTTAEDQPAPKAVHRVTFSETITQKAGEESTSTASRVADERQVEECETCVELKLNESGTWEKQEQSSHKTVYRISPSSAAVAGAAATPAIDQQDDKLQQQQCGCLADFRSRVEEPPCNNGKQQDPIIDSTSPNERHLVIEHQNELHEQQTICDSTKTDCTTVTTRSVQRRSMENIIRDEDDNEEQLTCTSSKSAGDSYKITTTSIRIGGAHLQCNNIKADQTLNSETHTSIIPIQTHSTRRRNLGSTRLAKLQPSEDSASSSYSYSSSTEDANLIARLSAMPSPPVVNSLSTPPSSSSAEPSSLAGANSSASFCASTNSDILDYSPILSGVRDYINTVNTELQVQTATVSGSLGPLLGCGGELVLPLQSVASPQDNAQLNGSRPMAQILLTASPSGSASNELEVNSCSTTGGGVTGDGSSGSQSGVGEAQSHIANVMQVTNFATNGSVAGLVPVSSLDSLTVASPKKSIFDGASKDEILEYLQDARERVPDILMAADDVMVISENELIVVNRLESGSPATPISIVETTEMVASTSPSLSISATSSPPPSSQIQNVIQKMYEQNSLQFNPIKMANDEQETSENHCETEQLQHDGQMTRTLQITSQQMETQDQVGSESKLMMVTETGTNEPPTSLMISYNSTGERRNSTSSDGSCTTNQVSRQRALKMLRLQQRYSSKRDSLSSPPSSPQSSASPTSSTASSSNQNTSGNCSVASTFYASSSISCSSPFLAVSSCGQSTAAVSATTTTLTSTTSKMPITITDITISTNNAQIIPIPIAGSNEHHLHVDRDDSGLGTEISARDRQIICDDATGFMDGSCKQESINQSMKRDFEEQGSKLSIIEECRRDSGTQSADKLGSTNQIKSTNSTVANQQQQPTFSSSANLMSRTLHGHYATMSRLNNYFMNRHPLSTASTIAPEATVEFQCLDCDQFIDVDHAKMMDKSNELRQLRSNQTSDKLDIQQDQNNNRESKLMTSEQLDRAYIAAMNGLPLCKLCEKKRTERKEIISEFVETELKYGHDLRIIYDEFYRPMQIAGLLVRDQIGGVFLNLEELIMAHCKFAGKLQAALNEAHSMGDIDYNTVNIGRLFVESAEMLSTYEYYCIRQGPAACLLARLAKEKELLRIFLRVSQMENTLLRRMNLAAFLMVPVQRVTKYPLLLNRLYKVTAYYHKDREALRDAQLKVELHLEHINQQTKGAGATNKIWRRISNLSAPISNRRCLINAEDLGYIKLRKTAMDMLKWDRDDTQFIHSGKLHFAPLNEFLTKQKAKPIRYMAAHALLVVLGKPNWKYRPDLVKSNLDCKLMTPTPGGNGIKETALLLFREKNGRFVACREPLLLSNCVLSADCSQYNSECTVIANNQQQLPNSGNSGQSGNNAINRNKLGSAVSAECSGTTKSSTNGPRQQTRSASTGSNSASNTDTTKSSGGRQSVAACDRTELPINSSRTSTSCGDAVSISSVKSLPDSDSTRVIGNNSLSATVSNHSSSARSHSLASALTPNTPIVAAATNLSKSSCVTSSNMTIISQLRTKVGSYHKQVTNSTNSVTTKQHVADQQASAKGAATTHSAPTTGDPDRGNSSSVLQNTATKSILTGNTDQSITLINSETTPMTQHHHIYNHHFFHNHHQPYGDYEESFEIHERLSKESMLMRADTPLKTRYWLQMLRYHAKDLGQWRVRRNGLANIMMMRQD